MVQRPPPPPPPPPQRLPPTGQDRSTQTVFVEEGTSTVEIQANVHEASKLKIRSLNGEIIQILVHPDMSQGELSHSIAHAVLSPSEGSILVETWSGGTGIVDSSRIAGLFRESDGMFVPFRILLCIDCQLNIGDVFRVSQKPARQLHLIKEPKVHPHLKREISLYVIIASYLGWMLATGENVGHLLERSMEKTELIFLKFISLPAFIVETFVDYPLKELYRSGPSILGWEGQPLPRICSQITHMGDEMFWSRNVEECRKIYDAKELASLHFRKPVLFLILAYLFFIAIRSLLHTWAVREQRRPNQEMIEIYQTFKMLMKVLQRGLNARDDDKRRGRYQ